MNRCLGEGKFSKVFEARMALDDSWNSEEITVAVKKPVLSSSQSRADFLQEAHTIRQAGKPLEYWCNYLSGPEANHSLLTVHSITRI